MRNKVNQKLYILLMLISTLLIIQPTINAITLNEQTQNKQVNEIGLQSASFDLIITIAVKIIPTTIFIT